MRNIPLIKPYLPEGTESRVIDVLKSGYMTEGPVTRELEQLVQDYIGCNHVLAVTSCTTGLEIALRALGIGPGDEVIIPDYTYPATASVINIVGADIVIVDIDKNNMLIDYDEIEKAITGKTKAIIPVSLFGNPLDYKRLNQIKSKYNLKIVEDAACSLGAESNGEKVGTFADISVFSMHPRKFITSGEGGLVTTNDQELADWMNSYKHFGMGCKDSRLSASFDIIGTNYKLSNILAAVAVPQMQMIEELAAQRCKLAAGYIELLKEVDSVIIPDVQAGCINSYQTFSIFVDRRDEIMANMRKAGVEVQIGTYSLHMHKAFNSNEKCRIYNEYPDSVYAFEKCLALPLYHEMTENDQKVVVELLKKELNNI